MNHDAGTLTDQDARRTHRYRAGGEMIKLTTHGRFSYALWVNPDQISMMQRMVSHDGKNKVEKQPEDVCTYPWMVNEENREVVETPEQIEEMIISDRRAHAA